MTSLAGLPFSRLELDRVGNLLGAPLASPPAGTTDLIVISHGWKSDADEATDLYATLLTNVAAAANGALSGNGRSFAVVGIYWPSFRFNKDLSVLQEQPGTGGAVGAAFGDRGGGLPPEVLQAFAKNVAAELMAGGSGAGLDPVAFGQLAVRAANSDADADRLLDVLRAAMLEPSDDDWRYEDRALREGPGRDIIRNFDDTRLARIPRPGAANPASPAADFGAIGARIGDWYRGTRATVAWILNQATYYEMKARAGHIGQAVAAMLDAQPAKGIRLHLIGHSFGARLVSAICANLKVHRPQSLTLLQGAFSHNGFSANILGQKLRGAFCAIIEQQRVQGPILVTHTHNDIAVRYFYAVASAVTGEVAANVGDRGDPHGGIGANGAQGRDLRDHIDPVTAVKDGIPLALHSGKITNLLADAIVADHGDVTNPAVAAWVWQALR